ncbi:MAG: L-threonylcarbamoyladenylate synthase [Candidatus Helarchaeota archaeon]
MVEILKIHPKHPNLKVILHVRDLIKEGKLIVFPTDTVYGLAADPFNEQAIKKVLNLKRRTVNKGLPVLVGNMELARELVFFSPRAIKLATRFWPGALTLILPIKKAVSNLVTGNRTTLGLRIPNHEIARKIAERPIIGTSANISGQPAPVTALEAIEQLGESVDLVIDSGPAKAGIPSTIIDLSQSPPKILREGAINKERLKPFL